jgi:iron complex outermembrane receptor protein
MFENSAAFGKTNAAFIRGIGQGDFNLAGAEAGVGIYLDDVDYATTLGSAFDLFDLQSIDIERGPQGTLQGKNAIGGAIILHSKQPTGDGTGYEEATVGDFSRRDFKAAYDMSIIPDSLFLRVSVFSENRNGYVTSLNYACANPQPRPAHRPRLTRAAIRSIRLRRIICKPTRPILSGAIATSARKVTSIYAACGVNCAG